MGSFARLAEEMGDIEYLAWREVWLYADGCSEIIRAMTLPRRRRVASSLVAEMLEFQCGICPLCDQVIDRSTLGAFHVDHVIPFVMGGGYERKNLQVTHPACNIEKGDFVDLYDLVPYLESKAEELREL
jgi:5-methylcytosine-specific restriction endonuclease McrA